VGPCPARAVHRPPRGGVPRTHHRSSRLCLTAICVPGAVSRQPCAPRQVPCSLYSASCASCPHRCCTAARSAAPAWRPTAATHPAEGRAACPRTTRRPSPPAGRRYRAPPQDAQKLLPARPATADAGVIAPHVRVVQALVAQRRGLLHAIADFDQAMAPRAQSHPAFPLCAALPGAGAVFAPRLRVACGAPRERYASADARQQ
jgi:hypothetical protein